MEQDKRSELECLTSSVVYDAITTGVVVILGGMLWMIFGGWFSWFNWLGYIFMGLVVPFTGVYGAKTQSRCTVLFYGVMCGVCLAVSVVSFIVSCVNFSDAGGFHDKDSELVEIICNFLLILLWILLGISYLISLVRAGRLGRALKHFEENSDAHYALPQSLPPLPVAPAVQPTGGMSPMQESGAPPAYGDHNAFYVPVEPDFRSQGGATSPRGATSARGATSPRSDIV